MLLAETAYTLKTRTSPHETKQLKLAEENAAPENDNFAKNSETALEFVEQLTTLYLGLLQDLPHLHDVSLLASDDVVGLAERLLQCQSAFQQDKKPHAVTLGYHYTDDSNIPSIRETSLLSRPERQLHNTGPTEGGSRFGDGIYFANNPVAFNNYGDTGMLVAMIKGRTSSHCDSVNTDSVIGNRMNNRSFEYSEEEIEFWDETVVKATSQCLPLLVFRKPIHPEDDEYFLDQLWLAHCRLQACLDNLFNRGVPTTLSRVIPPTSYNDRLESAGGVLHRQFQSVAPTHQDICLPRPPQSIEEFLSRNTKTPLREKLRKRAELLVVEPPWSKDDARIFLQGIKQNGCDWDKIAATLPTHSTASVKSYASRHFPKLVGRSIDSVSPSS